MPLESALTMSDRELELGEIGNGAKGAQGFLAGAPLLADLASVNMDPHPSLTRLSLFRLSTRSKRTIVMRLSAFEYLIRSQLICWPTCLV